MRYINKSASCREFDDYVKKYELDKYLDKYIGDESLKKHPWKKVDSKEKDVLKKHLFVEQKGLCVYCQQGLGILSSFEKLLKVSHIEHLKPKSRNKFPEDTFNQKNLVLSCEGFDCKLEKGLFEFCGHRKQEKYNKQLFLNPVEIEDVERYFKYNFEGEIEVADNLHKLDSERARYMIEILDLNNQELIDMRKDSFIDIIENYKNKIDEFLNEEVEILPSFFSMLKQLLIKK